MKINDLIGVSGSINSGKDLVGGMLQYIDLADNPTYDEYQYEINLTPDYEIKKCAEKLKEVVAITIGCKRSDLENEEFKNKELGEEWWRYEMVVGKEKVLISKGSYEQLSAHKKTYWNLVKLTPRMILQQFGTQGGRMVIHPNIWVNALFADFIPRIPYLATNTWPDHQSKWIITDVRFPENEGKAVKDRGGLLIGIKRHFALKHPEYAFRAYEDRPYEVPTMLMNDNEKLFDSLNHESEIVMGDHSWCDVVIENNGTIEELFNNVLDAVKVNIKLKLDNV
jgi:hypothetical protein